MKKKTILILIMMTVLTVWAEQVLVIEKKDGTRMEFPEEWVDSITYSEDEPRKALVHAVNSVFAYVLSEIEAIRFEGTYGTFTDPRDGYAYKTVRIGNQVWLAENLRAKKYRDGTPIPNITDNDEWSNLSSGAYCAYGNEEGNVGTYGYLYNWFAVSESRGLAPEGWHIATDDEWKELEMFLGMSQVEVDKDNWRGADEGYKLKAESGWEDYYNGSNEVGFTALPGGCRGNAGVFQYLISSAYFWTASKYESETAWARKLHCSYDNIARSKNYIKKYGFSIRCVRDN